MSQRKDDKNYEGPVDEKLAEYVGQLMDEKDSVDPVKFPIVTRLIQNELDRLAKGQDKVHENNFIDLLNDEPITLYAKALPPTKTFPKFNYAGRIIGPKGTYLKALMKETMTKMVLLGKGVMKDKEKEEILRQGTEPKYFHLNEDMHVAIQVTAPAAEAYARVAYAITCLKQQVMSDNRMLETLPWIEALNMSNEGNGYMPPGTRFARRPPGPGRPPPPYPPRHAAPPHYEMDEEPYHRPYEVYSRETSSPPPPKSYYSQPQYEEISRRPTAPQAQHETSTRAMSMIAKARIQSRAATRSSSYTDVEKPYTRPSTTYDYQDADPYGESDYFQYGNGGDEQGGGSWSSQKRQTGKSTWSTHPPSSTSRYTPYKK